ncbi:MAG: DNA helicase RecQ [Alphaproteobacteria bacterium]|nr:DNA helicase RecQ [Alphaproteobacteria bacterium]
MALAVAFEDRKREILREVYGFEDFRPGQEDVVDCLLAGRHALAVMPTGAGKSLCFQVPALALGGLTVVVSPLVALMQDQVSALRLAGVQAETIHSARDRSENVDSWRRVTSGEAPILYLAPERLMTERMLSALARLPIKLFAVDEAHCISQWGPAFRPEYEGLARLKDLFPGVPIAALTATADEVTRQDIADRLFDNNARMFVTGFDRPNIKLAVSAKSEWRRQMMDFLESHKDDSGIVYCLSRKKTDETAAYLREKGVDALTYHAGMEKAERERNQDAFMTRDGVVMVAPSACGMGIDKPDIRFVVHADLPGSVEAYYQEIGRAGRDGEPAEVMMLYGLDDIRMRRVFIEQEESSDDRRRREHQRLGALIGYCEAPGCRRRTLLSYFGEDTSDCGNCDMCLDPVPITDGGFESGLVLGVVAGTGQRYGATHIIEILRGGSSDKITRGGHDRLPEHGAGASRKAEEWRSIVRQLVAAGFLHMDVRDYGGLKITGRGEALQRGEESFSFRNDVVAGASKLKTRKVASTPTTELDEAQTSLLGELKSLRSKLARARGVPAYVVFTDRALQDMAHRTPTTRDEFAEVHGVGAAKLKDLADPFLEAIARFNED